MPKTTVLCEALSRFIVRLTTSQQRSRRSKVWEIKERVLWLFMCSSAELYSVTETGQVDRLQYFYRPKRVSGWYRHMKSLWCIVAYINLNPFPLPLFFIGIVDFNFLFPTWRKLGYSYFSEFYQNSSPAFSVKLHKDA